MKQTSTLVFFVVKSQELF